MVLSAHSLQISHSGRPPLLREVSFAVRRGQVLCLLARNGAGKTTLLRALLGTHRPDLGSVHLEGREVSRLAAREVARQLAYVPQAGGGMPPFSVADVVLMGRTCHFPAFASPSTFDRRLALDSLARLGIVHLRDRRFTEISGGERQLVLIARALAQQAEVMLLDEPTANLDFGNQIRILRIVRDLATEGYAVVMATHFPDHALLSRSRVAILHDGLLFAEGEAAAVLTEDRLRAVYGAPIRIVTLPPNEAANEPIVVCVPILNPSTGGFQ